MSCKDYVSEKCPDLLNWIKCPQVKKRGVHLQMLCKYNFFFVVIESIIPSYDINK